MSFTHLKDALRSATSGLPASSQLKAAFIVAEANKALKEVFGERAELQARAKSYKEGVLVIECQNGAVAQELGHQKKQILELLNNGQENVSEIKTKIG